MKTTNFLKPEHLAPITSLALKAKGIVEGLIAGQHRSPYHGFSSEFLEYRPYRQGESASKIDWRHYARNDRSVVRLFEDETNLYATILLDKSASMGFYSGKNTPKYDYAKTLAASIAWILIRQKDAVGLSVFDNTIDQSIRPKSTNKHLHTIISILEKVTPSAQTNSSSSIHKAALLLKKRGMTILISDLFDDADSLISSLRHLKYNRQDIIILRILDPFEAHFDSDAKLHIRDIETGEEMNLDGATAQSFYASRFQEHEKKISDACRELSIDLVTIETDEPFAKALINLVEKRRRLF